MVHTKIHTQTTEAQLSLELWWILRLDEQHYCGVLAGHEYPLP